MSLYKDAPFLDKPGSTSFWARFAGVVLILAAGALLVGLCFSWVNKADLASIEVLLGATFYTLMRGTRTRDLVVILVSQLVQLVLMLVGATTVVHAGNAIQVILTVACVVVFIASLALGYPRRTTTGRRATD